MNQNPPADRLASDHRGVSEVLGAVLVFALLLALLVIIQLAAVPIANQQSEYAHNQRVLGDFQDLGGAVDRAGTLGTPGSTAVETGFRYTNRLFLLNPPAPTGRLETESGTFVLLNANAINAETGDYLDGTDRTFETQSLVYRPNYNEYANAPVTRYEGWTLYNQYETANIVYSDKGLLADRRVSLTALDGARSTAEPGTITVGAAPVSAPAQIVSVRGESADAPLTIHLTTGLTADDWTDMLSDEPHFAGASQVNGETVAIELAYADADGPITYDLRLAKVGVGSATTDEGPYYLTTADRLPQITPAGGTITVEVRDRFNAPVPGAAVTFEAESATLRTVDGAAGETVSVITDEDGRATVGVTPAADVISIDATTEVAAGPTEADRRIVSFDGLTVDGANQDAGEINPDNGDSVKIIDSELIASGPNNNKAPYFVDLSFKNKAPMTKTIESVRVNGYLSNTFNENGQISVPDYVRIDDGTVRDVGGPYAVPDGTFETVLSSGETATYRFEFRIDEVDNTGVVTGTRNFEPNGQDVIIYSVRFTDGTTSRYFIQTDVR